VAVVFFLVVNVVWVWPHFGDWGETKGRMEAASARLNLFENGTNLIPDLEKKIRQYQGQGQIVPSADQAVQFVRIIQNQTTQFGIIPENMVNLRQPNATNSFFVDQAEAMTIVTTEKQLVEFLYSLGAGANSLIRVKSLSVQPHPSHERLTARVTLVASYQKKAIGSVGAAAPARPAATAPAAKPAPGGGAVKPPTNAPARAGMTNRGPAAPQKNLTPTKK
jgi:hypothetical protein